MFFVVLPANGGLPIANSCHLYEAISVMPMTAIACIDRLEGVQIIKQLNELEYLRYFKAGKVKTDKPTIKADGIDTATVTAEVHPDLTEITFYHADTNEPIATVPVDPATRTVALKVTATTPGVIRIRAGEPTITKLNEVVITAQ